MKKIKFNKISIVTVLAIALVLGFTGPGLVQAVTSSPALGATSTYGIVSSTYTNSLNAGLETRIVGDVCYSTPPGTAPISISGATVNPCTNGGDQATALANLNSQVTASCTSLGTNVVLFGTYTPGCYSSTGTMDITLSTNVTLNGAGTYIFKSGTGGAGAITTGANSNILLTNGANASDVFWIPTGGALSLGANSGTSATPTFVGTIIADAAGSYGVNLGHFANLLGRVLAYGHTVTTDSNTITVPTTLHLRKIVSGGSAADTAWTLTANGTGGSPTNLTGTTPVDSDATFKADTYALAETGAPSGYTASLYSCVKNGGSAVLSNSIILATGDVATCTITNTSTTATLNVIKHVVTNNGGVSTANAWTLAVTSSNSGSGTGSAVGSETGTMYTLQAEKAYSVTESGGPSGYLETDSANCIIASAVAGTSYTCTITNDDIAPVSQSSGGGTVYGCTDPTATNYISSYVSSNPALCIYGVVTPLIHITKVPSPLALLAGPGIVTYTEKVTNPGVTALSNIIITDDKCSPLNYISGDLNNNSKLDTTETWTYTCQINLTKTTTNTATVEGTANGLIVKDSAIATVIVSTPGLPKTGFPPRGEDTMWYAIISAGILVSSVSFYLVKNKKTI